MKKRVIIASLVIAGIGAAMPIVASLRRQGSLVVTVDGCMPTEIAVAGDGLRPDTRRVFPSTDVVTIDPLPYGPYEITISFPDGSMVLTVYHDNNWQREHVAVRLLPDGKGTVELTVEGDLRHREDITLTPEGSI